MTDQEFEAFSSFIYARYGIKMKPAKKHMLTGRLAKRLRSLGMRSFAEYYDHICNSDRSGSELQAMVDQVTTNQTDFFREPKHFEYLTQVVLPEIVSHRQQSGDKTIRIWSAGCSTGEEPYTLAMLLHEFCLHLPGWNYALLATDLSSRVLDHARRGIYDHDRIQPVSMALRKKYLLRSRNAPNTVRISKALQSKISFRQLNFMDKKYTSIPLMMDVIFCRNVLIYFDKQTQENVIGRFCEHLTPTGHLFLGHSETIHGYNLPLRSVHSTIYRRTDSIGASGVR